VVAGVLIAFAVNRFIWPNLARTRLRRKMGKTVVEMADLYSKLIASFVKKDKIVSKEYEKFENILQVRIVKLRALVGLANMEPRIKVIKGNA
jgi:hypothetical protein